MEMEPRRKLVASRCVSREVGTRVDRFTSLPEHVAHHILSFAAIGDLTRFGCASKRCTELYLSAPSLNFRSFNRANLSPLDKRLEFMSSLDRFLLVHRWGNKLQRLSVHWPGYRANRNESFQIITWIHNAVKCNVEVLELIIGYTERSLPFPLSVWRSRSLKSLLLAMSCTISDAPSLTSFSNIEYLKLQLVKIIDEGFFEWISCSCKSINELSLEDVYGIVDITIQSSSLKVFRFKHELCNQPYHLNITGENLQEVYIDWGYDAAWINSLNVFAPDLKYLKWSGDLWTQPNLGTMNCLQKAEFFLNPTDINIYKILCSLSSAEVLTLNKETILAMSRAGSLSAVLENVRHLSIHIGRLFDSVAQAVSMLLGAMPNLSTLDIKSDPFFFEQEADTSESFISLLDKERSGFTSGFWKVQPLEFIQQLIEVTIELPNGSNGTEFAKYILEHAHKLKKMTIVHSPQQSDNIRMLKESKMAANAKVVYQVDKKRGTKKQRGQIVSR